MIDKINFVYACPIPSNKTQRCCDISFKENLRAFLVSKLGKNIEHRLLVFIECKQADIFMPHFPSKFNDFEHDSYEVDHCILRRLLRDI